MKFTFTAAQRVQITGVGDFFRLLSTVGPVTVEFYNNGREIAERVDVEAGFAEQFRTIEFDRVDITSASAQLVQWETALGSEIRYDRGAATVSGTVALDAATLSALEQINVRQEQKTGFYNSTAAMAANTAVQIIAPGTNTAGVILLSANIFQYATTVQPCPVFIAKATAPANIGDGEILFSPTWSGLTGTFIASGHMDSPQYIEAGLGLYVISQDALPAAGATTPIFRACRFKVL